LLPGKWLLLKGQTFLILNEFGQHQLDANIDVHPAENFVLRVSQHQKADLAGFVDLDKGILVLFVGILPLLHNCRIVVNLVVPPCLLAILNFQQ